MNSYTKTKIYSITKQLFVCTLIIFLSACGSGSASAPNNSNTSEDSPSPNEGTTDTTQDNTSGTNQDNTPATSLDDNTNHSVNHHCAMVPSFADTQLMTISAKQSGSWTDAETWGGTVPVDGDLVHIPKNIKVSINNIIETRIKTIRLDGKLSFSTSQNTQLSVDSLISTCSGTLEIGTNEKPIQSNVNAKILFIDDGPVSDLNQMARGAILIGKTYINGHNKTHRAVLGSAAKMGDSIITLKNDPKDWRIGDELVITGTTINNPASDEIRKIVNLNDNQIHLDRPLILDHIATKPELNVYVANLTRNIEFVSENTSIRNRGHIMIMNSNTVIQNARFSELGRTDKTTALNDYQFIFPDDSNGDDAPATAELIPLGGYNIRGRYALHFHRNGTDSETTPSLVKGSVVFKGPGWGFVNHSSHVDFIDNVSYGLHGAGFYTEAGDEIGRMQRNIAIRSVNPSFTTDERGAIDPDLRAEFMDYGNDGDGFWLTGNRVSLIDNVAAGASAHGFIFWSDGIMEIENNSASRVTIPVKSLPNNHLITNRQSIPVWWAPLAENSGNESYGNTIGFRARYIHANNYLGRDGASDFHRSPPKAYIETLKPSINNLTVWGNRDGVLLNYNERLSLNNATIVGFGKNQSNFQVNDGTAKTGVGLDVGTSATHGPATIENVTIEGFGAGFVTPVNGNWSIQNVTLLNNKTDMYIQQADSSPTIVDMRNISFSTYKVDDNETPNGFPEHILIRP